MTTKEKDIIKDTIKDLLKLRKMQLSKNRFMENPFKEDSEYNHINIELKEKRDIKTFELFDIPLIKLNNLLKFSEQFNEVLEIEKQMTKIQAKKYITTKEMEDIYNISVSSQKDYRGRLNDPLPFNQKVFRGKITYTVEDIEKWLKNQNKQIFKVNKRVSKVYKKGLNKNINPLYEWFIDYIKIPLWMFGFLY